ncbi:hypothetical protein HPB47_006695 [Ixodes persulcatus]|uniref:Uncharacterized protein n=1 Tax=Ixodes persulcatus TaxID=34615 RepID=A0AC60PA67_IXOPE|nr:hypothetical protein HPB47_006695 [Ixodes persulcatus]
MPGDSRLKESTRRSFGKKTRRAWNKRKTSPASAPLRSAPLPNALDLSGASASLPVDDAAASSSGTDGSSFAGTTCVDSTYYSTAEQAQRAERSEQCKHVLSGKSATQWKFDLLEVNGSCLTSDAGTQFVIVDMKVLNDLFAHARCGSCGAGSLTLSKAADKEYGLAVKLVLVCSTCSFQKKQFSSPRVAGTAKITPFEINMRAMKGIQSISKGVTALADFCACMNISHRGLHHKTYQGHLKTFVRALGYVSAFEPYYDSTTESLCQPDFSFTCRIVLHLFEKDVLLTGTVMTNRKHMFQQLKKKMKKGNVAVYRKGDSYMALAWQDKHQVTMLSSAHNPSTTLVTRTQAHGQAVTLDKPVVICD